MELDKAVGDISYIGKDKNGDGIADTVPTEIVSSTVITDSLHSAVASNSEGDIFNVEGQSIALLQVIGTFSATISFYGSTDDVNYELIKATNLKTGYADFKTNVPGLYEIKCSVLKSIKAVITGYSSGTITIVGRVLPTGFGEKYIETMGRVKNILLNGIVDIGGSQTVFTDSYIKIADNILVENYVRLKISGIDYYSKILSHTSGAFTIEQIDTNIPVGTYYEIIDLSAAQTGTILDEQKTETDAVSGTVTFSKNISIIEIFNTDTTNAGVFTVNGITLHVPKNQVYKAKIRGVAGTTVAVTGATTYIISTYI